MLRGGDVPARSSVRYSIAAVDLLALLRPGATGLAVNTCGAGEDVPRNELIRAATGFRPESTELAVVMCNRAQATASDRVP